MDRLVGGRWPERKLLFGSMPSAITLAMRACSNFGRSLAIPRPRACGAGFGSTGTCQYWRRVMLSFSRGAIIACVASLILLLGLTFASASSSSERRRTVVVAVSAQL